MKIFLLMKYFFSIQSLPMEIYYFLHHDKTHSFVVLSCIISSHGYISIHSFLLLEEQQPNGCRGRKRKRNCNRWCNRSFILDEIDHLTEIEFQKMFWMNWDSFEKLYQTLEPLLHTPNSAMAC